MTVVAVTGTNGKTSTTQWIAKAMSLKTDCAVIGTLGNGIWSQGN
jgi:UDP-N-acetylmuramoyl-L-alanyl-D-glutamate--2,6-diaminopimelate ligase